MISGVNILLNQVTNEIKCLLLFGLVLVHHGAEATRKKNS